MKLFDSNLETLTHTFNNIIKAEFYDKRDLAQAEKLKLSIPLGDCIRMDYSDEGEVVGFQLRPKLASLAFCKDNKKTNSVSYMMKIVAYMNRLLIQGKDLFLT